MSVIERDEFDWRGWMLHQVPTASTVQSARKTIERVMAEVVPLQQQLEGAVERVNAALRIVEDHRDARGNVQMGRGFASQVVELLRAAGGQ